MLLDLRDCLRDAPAYRSRLHEQEDFVGRYETAVRGLTKMSRAAAETSKDLSSKYTQFTDELGGFTQSAFDPTDTVGNTVDKFCQTIREIERNRTMQAAQLMDVFVHPLEEFVKHELQPVKDLKKQFDRSSDDYDYTLNKVMAKRPKDPSIPDGERDAQLCKTAYLDKSMQYAIALSDANSVKRLEFVEYVLAFMFTQYAFFHQGYEMLKDLEPMMRELTDHLHQLRAGYRQDIDEAETLKRQLNKDVAADPDAANFIGQGLGPEQFLGSKKANVAIKKSGYLFLRTSYTLMASWNRRYFELQKGSLVHCDRNKEKDQETINLQVSTVKLAPQAERRFCFEIISPTKTYVLQAQSERDLKDWITCIQCAIEQCYYTEKVAGQPMDSPQSVEASPTVAQIDPNASDTSRQEMIDRILAVPGNDHCADCGSQEPAWASINMGTILCIDCSGIHRSLGVHVSKVRSLTLDKWEPEQVQVMLRLGNQVVNNIFEACLGAGPDMPAKITPATPRADKAKWIVDKYVNKSFMEPTDSLADPHQSPFDERMWLAVQHGDLAQALGCIALGANVNYRNETENYKTALHQAALQSSYVSVEFLLHWFADINAVDGDGRTCLHYASAVDDASFVWFLLKKNARLDVMDNDGVQPLDMALEAAHVQVVMALRYATFLRETAGPGDLAHHENNFEFQQVLRPAYPVAPGGKEISAGKPRSVSEVAVQGGFSAVAGGHPTGRRQSFATGTADSAGRTRHVSLMPERAVRPIAVPGFSPPRAVPIATAAAAGTAMVAGGAAIGATAADNGADDDATPNTEAPAAIDSASDTDPEGGKSLSATGATAPVASNAEKKEEAAEVITLPASTDEKQGEVESVDEDKSDDGSDSSSMTDPTAYQELGNASDDE